MNDNEYAEHMTTLNKKQYELGDIICIEIKHLRILNYLDDGRPSKRDA